MRRAPRDDVAAVKAPLLRSGGLLDVAARSALDAASDAATTTLLNCYLREGGTATSTATSACFPELGDRAPTSRTAPRRFHHRFRDRAARRRAARAAGAGRLLAEALDPGRAAGRAARRACARASTPSRAYLERAPDDVERLWSAEPLQLRRDRAGAAARPPAAPDAEGPLRAARARTRPSCGRTSRCTGSRSTAERVAHDSATGTPAPELAAQLLGARAAPGRILLPAHPWEAGYLARAASDLFASGDVIDLGPAGAPVTPTTLGAHRLPRRLAVPAEVLAARAGHELDAGDAAQGAAAGGRGGAAGADAGRRARRGASRRGSTILQDPAYLLGARARTGSRVLLRENRWPRRAPT